MTQKRPNTIPKVPIDLAFTINLLFTHDFIQKDNSDYVWNKTLSSHVLSSKSLIWVQMSTLGLFWTRNEFFIDLVFTINLSFGYRGYCWLVFTINILNESFFHSKEFVRFYLKKRKNIILTCFDMKISHLGSNDYFRFVLDPK